MPGLYVYKYDPNIASCEELGFWDYETLKQKYPSEKWKYGKRYVFYCSMNTLCDVLQQCNMNTY